MKIQIKGDIILNDASYDRKQGVRLPSAQGEWYIDPNIYNNRCLGVLARHNTYTHYGRHVDVHPQSHGMPSSHGAPESHGGPQINFASYFLEFHSGVFVIAARRAIPKKFQLYSAVDSFYRQASDLVDHLGGVFRDSQAAAFPTYNTEEGKYYAEVEFHDGLAVRILANFGAQIP